MSENIKYHRTFINNVMHWSDLLSDKTTGFYTTVHYGRKRAQCNTTRNETCIQHKFAKSGGLIVHQRWNSLPPWENPGSRSV